MRIKTRKNLPLQKLLVERERQTDVDDTLVVDGKTAQNPDQSKHLLRLKRLQTDLDGISLTLFSAQNINNFQSENEIIKKMNKKQNLNKFIKHKK